MKALIKERAEPGIWMGEVDKPTIKDDEVLIKIKKTAMPVCNKLLNSR